MRAKLKEAITPKPAPFLGVLRWVPCIFFAIVAIAPNHNLGTDRDAACAIGIEDPWGRAIRTDRPAARRHRMLVIPSPGKFSTGDGRDA